jgi:hypothetical protein
MAELVMQYFSSSFSQQVEKFAMDHASLVQDLCHVSRSQNTAEM